MTHLAKWPTLTIPVGKGMKSMRANGMALGLLLPLTLGSFGCGGGGSSGTDGSGSGGAAGSAGAAGTTGMAGAAGAGGAPGGIQSGVDIDIDSGSLTGEERGGSRAFLGVPFAAPPVGDLRWKPPAPVEPWTGSRDATAVGAACPQPPGLIGSLATNEDCLFLNVWTPKDAPAEPVPVMVWIHGGAFALGSAGEPLYDGQALVEHGDRVVVTINYRLGALGLLAHPALTAESSTGSSGNYWLLDQIAALEWVQRNILAFGGDPDNVTIFGESAGGASVCALMASPLTGGLFHRGISESGLCNSGLFGRALADQEAGGVTAATDLGCGDAATAATCLRGKTDAELVGLFQLTVPPGGLLYAPADGFVSFPFVDGYVLPTPMLDRFTGGDAQSVPLMLGTNGDEARIFHGPETFAQPVTDEAGYREALGRRFAPADVDAIVAEYPIASFASANAALTKVSDDWAFVCTARRTARATAAAGLSTYLYAFEHIRAGATTSDHGSEIALVFGQSTVDPADRALSDAMVGYWTRFAATGDPNGNGAVTWPKYDATGDQHLELVAMIAAGSGRESQKCDFWEGIRPRN